MTEAEWQELAKPNGGEYPSLPHYELVGNKRQLVYISLAINGDKARAVYDEGVTGRTAILVRIDGRWYVGGIF